jgi:hypothetical protein
MGGEQIFAKALELTGMTGASAGLSSSLSRATSYTSNELYPNNIPDVQALIIMTIKGIYKYDRYVRYMKMYGFDEDAAANMYRANQVVLNPYEYITLYRRGYITHEQLLIYTKEGGLTESNVTHMLQLTQFFPTAGDLIRFAVRDVYNAERRRLFHLDDDISEKYITEATRTGLDREQATNYWAAHWELPSVLQGYEMLHRGVINESELESLMIASDIMPFWRDKLKQISYNPITRVDVRRMWAFGVITNFDELVTHYKDIGYNDKDAKSLADFTKAVESNEEKGLTRAAMIKAYKEGIITIEQLTEYFVKMGYGEDVVAFWVASAEYERTVDITKKWKDDIINRYLLGDYDVADVKKDLADLNLPQNYIDMVLDDLKHQTSAKLKLPSKDDLLNWFSTDIIDEQYFNNKMLLLGYKQEDIINYLTFYYLDNPVKTRRYLKPEQYVAWYKKEMLDLTTLENTLFQMGYNDFDVFNMLEDIKESKEELTYLRIDTVKLAYDRYRKEALDAAHSKIR